MRLFIVFGSLFVLACVAHGVAINGTSNVIAKNSGSGVIGPPAINSQRRVSKDLFKNVKPSSTNSTSSKSPDQLQRRSSTGQVQILESGSALRNRGESRILKRGPPVRSRVTNFNMRTAPVRGGSLRSSSAYAIGVNAGPSSVSSSASYNDNVGAIPLIPIPGNNIPPPVYMYGNEAPSPPGSSSGSNYGGSPGPGPAIVTYRPTGGSGGGGGFISSTFSPIIFPPEVGTSEPDFGPGPQPIGPNPVTSVPIIGGGGGNGGGNGGGGSGPTLEPFPGPQPIGPNPGTSVPIIGGGGGGGESVLPPSPPPDEIFPPAPPPDDDEEEEEDEVVEEEEFDVGRRLKVDSGSGGGTRTGARTRTRIIPSSRPTSTRVSSKEIFNSSKDRLRGGVMRRERLRDKVKEFKTVLEDEEEVQEEIIVDDPNVITDFVFSEIKCFKTRQEEYFGATIHMKNGFHLPYIRDRPQDPLSSEECKLEQMEGTRGSYHMSVTDLRGCGVEQCGDALCLTMVFPRVPMLALADDEVTTIKCIPQSSTVSDTKSISFAGDSTDNRRSSSTVEGGVQEFVAEVGVFRQNAGSANGLFVKRVNSGGVVQLGEPLQLRSVVRGTDGWKHTKLTDVKVWRMRDNLSQKLDNLDPNQASEVITLVDAHGCRNDEYMVIADEHPLRDPRNDMVHHFTFKAFLFRGQRVNEPLIVTARVHACQESQDCVMECESGRRVKRSPVELHNASSIVHDFDSQLALRVVGLKDHPSSILDDEFPFDYTSASQTYLNRTKMDNGAITCNEKLVISGFGGGCIALLICGLGLALFTYIRQGKITREKSSSPTYQYPPPPGRMRTGVNPAPYHKPLPPPPPSQQQQPPPPPKEKEKSMSSELSQVAELLQHFKNNEANNKNSNIGNKTSSKSESKPRESSEYACIDETNSSSSSSEDLTNPNKKDGVYILYCYNKDKKNKQKQIMLPLSAPTSMRLRRKHLKQAENLDDDDEDFIDDDDSETVVSQTEDATEESDDSYAVAEHGNNKSSNLANNINKNQGCRRTVRDVKKKSKQNNNLAYASTRSRIRRRVSSVYREGYIHGVRGGSSFPLRYKKSPSTGNIPAITGHNNSGHQPSAKRINFSVRESRSTRNKRHHQKNHIQDQYSSEGMLSEGTVMTSSDLDSAYSGSNCSKLTEDYLYELKRSGGDGNIAGRYPDARNLRKLQNLMDVQRQLRGGSGAQGQKQKFLDKQEVRRTSSANTNVQVGLGSPPLNLGETKATHFVTRDDSSTKILIVPETHV